MNGTNSKAYLNWRMDECERAANYGAMAEGYHRAAIRLADSLMRDNVGHDADVIVYPIIFSGHQSVELYLKGIKLLVEEAQFGDNPWQCEVKDSHDLERLLNSLNSKLPNNERIVNVAETKPLFDFIHFCKQVGDDSVGGYYVDFARYPEHLSNCKRSPVHYPFTRNNSQFIFSISALKKLIGEACTFVEGLYSQWLDRAYQVRDLYTLSDE